MLLTQAHPVELALVQQAVEESAFLSVLVLVFALTQAHPVELTVVQKPQRCLGRLNLPAVKMGSSGAVCHESRESQFHRQSSQTAVVVVCMVLVAVRMAAAASKGTAAVPVAWRALRLSVFCSCAGKPLLGLAKCGCIRLECLLLQHVVLC
ncbi:MAG: hypothetical protein ACRC24_03690 [Vibrionaceae bacterium]